MDQGRGQKMCLKHILWHKHNASHSTNAQPAKNTHCVVLQSNFLSLHRGILPTEIECYQVHVAGTCVVGGAKREREWRRKRGGRRKRKCGRGDWNTPWDGPVFLKVSHTVLNSHSGTGTRGPALYVNVNASLDIYRDTLPYVSAAQCIPTVKHPQDPQAAE